VLSADPKFRLRPNGSVSSTSLVPKFSSKAAFRKAGFFSYSQMRPAAMSPSRAQDGSGPDEVNKNFFFTAAFRVSC